MKLFVTGATGFIGQNFIKKAIESNHQVYALTRNNLIPSTSETNLNLDWIIGELDGDYEDIFKECDVLIHLASHGVSPQPGNWYDCIDVNVKKSTQLIHNAINSGINNFLVSGTFAEYGKYGEKYEYIPTNSLLKPKGPYASSKAMFYEICHQISKEKNIKIIYARLFSVYGEGQNENNLWPSLKKAAENNLDFKLTKGEQIRDFISVDSVCLNFLKIIRKFNNIKSGNQKVINIGSGVPKTVSEFSNYWWNKFESKGNLIIGALPYRKNEMMRCVPEIDKNFLI
jgi:nucleoside-diphosphate-sugar epimerase